MLNVNYGQITMTVILIILLTLISSASNAQERASESSQPSSMTEKVQDGGIPSAKQQLEAKGISFSEESFLNHVSNGDVDIVKLFLDAGISPSAKNQEGETALVIASKKGLKQIARMLIDAGADLGEVDSFHDKTEKKKDTWDKLAALSSIATVFASILIATLGWYFTQSYNSRQAEQNKIQNARDADLKEQQNRTLEMETMEKMIPHLLKDEESKRVALITIRNLARPELANQMAELLSSKASVLALQQFASSNNPEEKKQAANALSNIAISGDEQTKASALEALGSIFDNFKSAVVRIKSVSDSGQEFIGTGIIVTSEGHILTVKHVVAPIDAEKLSYYVELWDGGIHKATLQDINSTHSLAILRIEGYGYRRMFLLSKIPGRNTRVVAIGAILGGPLKPAVGTIRSATDQFLEIEFDIPGGMPGLSGAPVLDSSGDAVGIEYSFRHPLNQCIRSDIAKAYLKSKGIDPMSEAEELWYRQR